MRIVKEIDHPRFKITVFSWNGKYILKIEDGHLEQVYKISEGEMGLDEMGSLLSTDFLLTVLERFGKMSEDFYDAWKNRYVNSNPSTTNESQI